MTPPRPPHVFLDGRKIADFGIGTYIRGLLHGFLELGSPEELTIVGGGAEAATWAGRRPGWRCVAELSRPYSLAEQVALPRRLQPILPPGSVWHAPHYVTPLLLRAPMVVTVHDLIHLDRPDDRSPLVRAYALLFLSRAVERAAVTITATEAARARIQELVPEAAGRVRVVPHAVAPELLHPATADERSALRQSIGGAPFLLYVGNDLPHKNLEGLVRAFLAAAPDLPRDLELVIAGPSPSSPRPWTRLAADPTIRHRVRALGRVDVPTLRALYAEAVALVFPSLAEGFGLPPLEAMAQGTAVIAAGIAPVREALGPHALYVDPGQQEALTAALIDAARRPADRDARDARVGHARSLSWTETARRTAAAYATAVS